MMREYFKIISFAEEKEERKRKTGKRIEKFYEKVQGKWQFTKVNEKATFR